MKLLALTLLLGLFLPAPGTAQSRAVRLNRISDLVSLDLSQVAASRLPLWAIVTLRPDAESGSARAELRLDPVTKIRTVISTTLPLATGRGRVKLLVHGKTSIYAFHYRMPADFIHSVARNGDFDEYPDPFVAGGTVLIGGWLWNPLTERPVFVFPVSLRDVPLIRSAYGVIRANGNAFQSAYAGRSSRQRLQMLRSTRNPYLRLAVLQVIRPAQESVTEIIIPQLPTVVQGPALAGGERPVQQPVNADPPFMPSAADADIIKAMHRCHGVYLAAMVVCYLQGMTLSSQLHDETALAALMDAASHGQKHSIADALTLVRQEPELIRGVDFVHFAVLIKHLRRGARTP